MHFNGDKFDIPYIEKRAASLGISISFSSFQAIDIYKLIKPLKHILGLQDLRQKTVEMFLNINRKDMYSGGELIPVYKKYTMHNDDKLLSLLLLHNEEDVLNMHYIIPILKYKDIEDIVLNYKDHTFNTFTDYSGNIKEELIINYVHNLELPVSFKSNNNGIYIYYKNTGSLTIRVPVIETTLKLFYENTKDYYYLPEEDTCILKVIASGVDKNYRKNATKQTCYTKHQDKYLPCVKLDNDYYNHWFKNDYKSKDYYINRKEIECLSNTGFELYGKTLITL